MSFGFYQIGGADQQRLEAEMAAIAVCPEGIWRMATKGQQLVFLVTDLAQPAALILKQELLSKGGEAALQRDAILGGNQPQSVLLMATPRQYQRVISGLREQAFQLPRLADKLEQALAQIAGRLAPAPYHTPYLTGSLDFSRPLVMGIANLTPDSFYDGGRYTSLPQQVEHVLMMKEAGADIIDVGGASSRPGHTPVGEAEEIERILPLLEAIAPQLDLPISIDTDKAGVASAALQAGAAIINDISGLPPEMAQLAAASGAPTILMHQGGGPHMMRQLQDYFTAGIDRALAAGMQREQLILDPGLGFGKQVDENLQILRQLGDLQMFNLPLLIGLSNKRFIGAVLDAPLEARSVGNVAASVWALCRGAHIIRTHEPKELAQAARMVAAIRGEVEVI